ncbi:MAG: LPS export ABC transporter permease LptF [Methylophilales bacterium]|nr:LPS export ABC transporter permease LptF [Methylophilales bacterium]
MIFKKSLIHELYATALSSFLVLMGIMVAQRVTYYLGFAARGAVASDAIGTLLGFSLLKFLPLLLTLTVFIAVLMTLARWHRDSEMVVWFTSGQGMTMLVRPVLTFALPVIGMIAILSMFVSPWATQKGMDFREQMDSRDELSAIAPGVFKESQHADRVFFVERFSTRDSTVHNIFAQSTQHQKLGIIVAQQGSQSTDAKGDTFLTLQTGRRYEGKPNTPEFGVMHFESYTLRTEPTEAKHEAPSPKAINSLQLIENSNQDNMAELQWRLSLPISALLLVLLAIPLSFVDPRAGRSANLIMAILVYLIYNNMLSILQSWVARDKLSAIIGLWPAHIAIMLLFVYLFYRRLFLLPLLPRRVTKLLIR